MKRVSLCPVFGKCGGCSFLNIDYLEQLEIKKNKVKNILLKNKIKHFPELQIYFKNEYFYRNRMDFVFCEEGLGLRQKGNFRKKISISKCFIADEKINALVYEINKWFYENKEKLDIFDVEKNSGTLRYAVIRTAKFLDSLSVTFILNKDSEKILEQKNLVIKYMSNSSASNVLIGFVKHNSDLSSTLEYEIIKGNDLLLEKLCGFNYFYHSQGFFQNNPFVLQDMMNFVRYNINENYDLLFDLYGGVGTFGIFLSDKAYKVIIADNSNLGLLAAEKNIQKNNIMNAKIINFDDKKPDILLQNIVKKDDKKIFVIDPPRAGMHKNTLKLIFDISPEKIIYISCNPKQLSLELSFLTQKYNILKIAIFDMFPQTEHIETVAILQRAK